MEWKQRTEKCGTLSKNNVGQTVILNGWVASRRDLGGLIFVDMRDRYGLTQVVFEPEFKPELAERAKEVRSEFVIWVQGTVRLRESPNPKIPTGEIEIVATDFAIINRSELPPFEISDDVEVNEELKLKYRYLDLRRGKIQNAMAVRNQLYQIAHKYYQEQDFVEIETPVLMKSTPEGARDFLVPSRINKGKFYALPQSPQIYKQILMISGYDRYMQIVKCFRDEDLRSDRQPEFTQIDCEMSFVKQEDILKITEGFIRRLWKEVLNYDVPEVFEMPLFLEYVKPNGDTLTKVHYMNSREQSFADTLDFEPIKYSINSYNFLGEILDIADVKSTDESKSTQLYPNIAESGSTIRLLISGEINSDVQYTIFNELSESIKAGNTVLSSSLINGVIDVDLPELNRGMYYLQVNLNNKIEVHKFIIK